MSASARGNAQMPGKKVRQKAGLNRGILDAAWGEFRRQLEYKLAAHGGQVLAVNPAYTSRTCRVCGHEAAESRKSQALFACVACGHFWPRGTQSGLLERRPLPVEGWSDEQSPKGRSAQPLRSRNPP